MKIKSILLCLFLPVLLTAQNEWNTWYFGAGAGLDFSTNPPTVLDGGQINSKEGLHPFQIKLLDSFSSIQMDLKPGIEIIKSCKMELALKGILLLLNQE